MRTGIANLPLHYGQVPAWLFERMTKLARAIIEAMVYEFGNQEVLKRLADSYWFQSFGCVLGFDWHSSGLSTTVCGAIKEALRGTENELGIFVTGGKGKTSRKTPSEIELYGEKYSIRQTPDLIYASKMSAKVDNTAVQDGFQIYHHTFIFNQLGQWSVIQQGMNPEIGLARRYHWLSDRTRTNTDETLTNTDKTQTNTGRTQTNTDKTRTNTDSQRKSVSSQRKSVLSQYESVKFDFVNEPHSAVCCDWRGQVLNLVAQESELARQTSVALINDNFNEFLKDLTKIKTLEMPRYHDITAIDFDSQKLQQTLFNLHQQNPKNFEELLGTRGVGPKTVRALALISEIIYGAKPSYQDPVRYSFAHGGKDGTPYPVNQKQYDESIWVLEKAIRKAKIGQRDKIEALKSLYI